MKTYPFRIVNVFAESPLAGNPLCVFEDATRPRRRDDAGAGAPVQPVGDDVRAAVARATAHVRIFTPTFEMPFAGHPTLGTAHVVRALREGGDGVTLEMKAGIIPVEADGDVWTLRAQCAASTATRGDARRARGDARPRRATMCCERPLWVDTGGEQLVIPLASFDAVRRAAPRRRRCCDAYGCNERAGDGVRVRARTANACWRASFHAARRGRRGSRHRLGLREPRRLADRHRRAAAAALVGRPGRGGRRPCQLGLEVRLDQRIRVSGRVIELARGSLTFIERGRYARLQNAASSGQQPSRTARSWQRTRVTAGNFTGVMP